MTWSKHSRLIEPISLSAYAFCHGERGDVGRSRMPIDRSRGEPFRLAKYLATLVCPISMPNLSNSRWIRGAPHSGLAMLISRISRRISTEPLAGHHGVETSSASTTGNPPNANEQWCLASRSPTHRTLWGTTDTDQRISIGRWHGRKASLEQFAAER